MEKRDGSCARCLAHPVSKSIVSGCDEEGVLNVIVLRVAMILLVCSTGDVEVRDSE